MNIHGGPVRADHFHRKWHQALDRAGLPARTRFQYLKRFYTSMLGTSGLHDPKTVQVLSRHARFSETWDTYAQPPSVISLPPAMAKGCPTFLTWACSGRS